DERFATSLSRYDNQDQLDTVITEWTSSRDQYEAFHALQNAGIAAAPVLSLAQVYENPHLRAREMWQPVTHPVAGTHDYLKPPISHLSKTPLQYWRPAPTVGQDNEYVYKDVMGYSDEEYQWFVTNKHAGTTFINATPEMA